MCSFYRSESFDKVATIKKINIKEISNILSTPYINQMVQTTDKETNQSLLQKAKTISVKKESRDRKKKECSNAVHKKDIVTNDKSSDCLNVSIKEQGKKFASFDLEMILKKKKLFNKNNVPFSCRTLLSFCICNIDTIYRFKYINKAYDNIGVYMELVRYLKLYNDVDLIKRLCFDEAHCRLIEHDYSFYKNSEITYTHYKNKFNLYAKPKVGLSLSNLIVQSSA